MFKLRTQETVNIRSSKAYKQEPSGTNSSKKKKKQEIKYAEPAKRWQSAKIKSQKYVKDINAKKIEKALNPELRITVLNKIKN